MQHLTPLISSLCRTYFPLCLCPCMPAVPHWHHTYILSPILHDQECLVNLHTLPPTLIVTQTMQHLTPLISGLRRTYLPLHLRPCTPAVPCWQHVHILSPSHMIKNALLIYTASNLDSDPDYAAPCPPHLWLAQDLFAPQPMPLHACSPATAPHTCTSQTHSRHLRSAILG
jgi:hypothetical protein